MSAATTVRLTLPSEIRLVDLAHEASERLAAVAGLTEDQALNVGIAVREAVINAMKHGNRLDPSLKVDVVFSVKPNRLLATVRDEGEGFDPSATPDPTNPENLLRATGRGLLMIRAFVDDVRFKYREGRGMEIRMEKRVNSAPSAVGARPWRPEHSGGSWL